MPEVTLEHVFPATYVKALAQAPESATTIDLPNGVGATGTLGVLDVRYGSETRQICVFLANGQAFLMEPGTVTREGDLLVYRCHTKPNPSILRDPQPVDLCSEFVHAWRLTGPEVRDPQERAEFLETIKTRWRVLRFAEMG